MSSTDPPPTFKQLRYLGTLASRAGHTFATPHTRAQASAEIRRLKSVRSAGFTFAELEAEQAAREVCGDVAIVQACENRRPREHRYLEPAIMTALATETITTANDGQDKPEASAVFYVEHRCGRTGHRVELARYTVGGGEERVLYGQRVDGVVRFLPGNLAVLVGSPGTTEDSTCRSRTRIRVEGCTKAVRRNRPCQAPGIRATPTR